MRLIDANKFEAIAYKDTAGRENTFDAGVQYMAEMIDTAPTVDAVPVRHGRIIESWETGRSKRKFSCCGADCTTMTQWMWPKYCPYCGAKMGGGGDNDAAD